MISSNDFPLDRGRVARNPKKSVKSSFFVFVNKNAKNKILIVRSIKLDLTKRRLNRKIAVIKKIGNEL